MTALRSGTVGILTILLIPYCSTSPVDNEISSTDGDDYQQFDGPKISPSRSYIVLQKGEPYTLYCKANDKIHFKRQELSEDGVITFHTVEREMKASDEKHKYVIALDLVNVDEYAVGYYACFDSTVNSSDVLNYLTEEPNNTAHISYIYVYVNGSSLFAPMNEVINARNGTEVVIACRPATPDVKVELKTGFPEIEKSNKIGFLINADDISDLMVELVCEFKRNGVTQVKSILFEKYIVTKPPKPQIFGGDPYFLGQESFTLNCTVSYTANYVVQLDWNVPNSHLSKGSTIIRHKKHEPSDSSGVCYYNLTIYNATQDDAGLYECISKNSYYETKSSFKKTFLEKPFINLTKKKVKSDQIIETKAPFYGFDASVECYPKCELEYLKDNKPLLLNNKSKYEETVSVTKKTSYGLRIKNVSVYDTGNYTFVAKNGMVEKSINYDFRAIAKPVIDFVIKPDKRYMLNAIATIQCDVVGYPLPSVKWHFKSPSDVFGNETFVQGADKITSVNLMTSYLDMHVLTSGNITCTAENSVGEAAVTQEFFVYEMDNGFGIQDKENLWFSENQSVKLKCVAAKCDFFNVTWILDDTEDISHNVIYSETVNSYVAHLIFNSISLDNAGNYTCVSSRLDGDEEFESITLNVEALRAPAILEPAMDTELGVYPYQPTQLTCVADSIPRPTILWFKDEEQETSDSDLVEIIDSNLNRSTINSTLFIKAMGKENAGIYKCQAKSAERTESRVFNLYLNEKPPFKTAYLAIIAVIFVVLLIVVVYLIWKIKKEKQFRKELAAAGLLYFKEGVPKSLNPDLGIDEQAELLPYDEKFEFPVEKLKLGKQLGAGAFGVVYKAEARGIVNAEETTTVAVKMVKKTADNMFIKALASELKIMVHLGKHVNIVNLLGACTKNVGKRELIVIVEYCRFGNIHNYLQKHREVFIDQFNDSQDRAFGTVNRGFSSSSNNGSHSDYFAHTQNTEHTFLNSGTTNRSSRKEAADNQNEVELAKVSESGYLQPEWRSNYESDYSYDGRAPRPLNSRDLLAWAFQIARGMEYLAARKVLHGDLAARNILLADDNVVKICDFGLAKSIYKNDEYQKQENSPLPVKWLAIECMMDRIFSTQSDVWSFGIVLWELFSLAKTPYPNIQPQNLLQWLNEGNRLPKPNFSDDRLYKMMLKCWEQKPTARPTFTQLQETLGTFLEDNVRNHYVDLNFSNMQSNAEMSTKGGEDYLAIVSAPDYSSLLTPSPHHYVNETRSFFPPTPTLQLQHDDEGYLQMSPQTNQAIFSPRSQGTKFDFDARKLNSRVDESDASSEMTPMLTLNNLPRSGSESDPETSSSPYLNVCPRIEEETCEVFEKNTKNLTNPSDAVTNPTYISIEEDLQKKPKDIKVMNSYVNLSASKGLVK